MSNRPEQIPEKALVGTLLYGDEKQKARLAGAKKAIGGWGVLSIQKHRIILESLEAVLDRAEECDLVMLHSELAARGKLDAVGGGGVLLELIEGFPNVESWEDYAKEFLRLSARRKALELADKVRAKVERGEELNGELEELSLQQLEVTEGLQPAEKPSDWRKVLGGEVVDAEELAPFIDMPFPWLIEPLLCRGFLTQIQGAPKGGKSAFSLYLCLLSAAGLYDRIEAFRAPKADPLRVLYLAWEDPKIMMAKRLSLYAVGLGHERTFLPKNMRFLYAPQFFANRQDRVEALREAIKEFGADIVVIDTLSYAHECEENVADQMRIPMGNLTKLANDSQAAILYVHHTAKGAKEKSTWERGRGSAAIAAAWHILIDWGQRDPGSDVNPVEIQSKLGVDASWAINYGKMFGDPDSPKKITGVQWSISSTRDESGKPKREPSGQDLVCRELQALLIASPSDDGVSGNIIASFMNEQGMSRATTYRHLADSVANGTVAKKIIGKKTFYRPTGI